MPRMKKGTRRNKRPAAVMPLDTAPAPLVRQTHAADSGPRCSFCGRDAAAFTAAVRGAEGIICDACLERAKKMVESTPNEAL